MHEPCRPMGTAQTAAACEQRMLMEVTRMQGSPLPQAGRARTR